MVKVVNQDIPAWFYRQYERSLGIAQLWKPGSNIYSIRKRPPYRLPHMKTNSGNSPSGAQKKVRAAFKKCVDCFNASPKTGGVEPPAEGYRSKEWWYNKAGEATYPPYLGEEFLRWTNDAMSPFPLKDSDGINHDANWFLKTDEQDFIDFYDEMKIKYGYPWSASNNPDQIVTKMNHIVCDEIEYDLKADASKAYTPGQTALSRKGICDDQSILHFALTWKALKEVGWSDASIDYRLSCVFNDDEGQGHVYNWWKMNNGVTKIIENTYNPGTYEDTVGGMDSWNITPAWAVFQRFNKAGHWNPVVEANGDIVPLWYYNYFIAASWQHFFDNEIPDWCVGPVLDCELYDARYKMGYGKDDNAAVARQESWDNFTGKDWGSTESQQCLSYSKWVKYPWSYYRYYKYVWKAKYRIDLTNYSKGSYSSALLVIVPETIPLFDEYYCPFGWAQDSRNIIEDITSHLGTIYEPDIYFPAEYFNFWPDVDADYMGYKAFPKVYLTSIHATSE